MDYDYVNRTVKLSAREYLNDVEKMVFASRDAYKKYSLLSLSKRREIIEAIKNKLFPLVTKMAAMELEETGMGNNHDKIIKLLVAIQKTPGVEDLITDVLTGDEGMTLFEYSAYGIICTIQPGTNPCATLICNTIGILASGNSVIHIPNPRCVKVSSFVVQHINNAICEVCGISDLVVTLHESSLQYADEIMYHPDVSMVVATGGESMLNRALKCSKRVIGAGQANPVVIVDDTADLSKAAQDIVEGASFDNNIMCISEKNIVIVDSVADKFSEELMKQDVYFVNNESEMLKLTKATLNSSFSMKRALEGKSANVILEAAGIGNNKIIRLIVVDTVKSHPFATKEMLMPLVPMIRVRNFDEALDIALILEQGYKHTSIIHSNDINHLNKAAHLMQTSIFIKNSSSLAALGFHGEGDASFTIANITGEGATTARHFARRRRCTLTTAFSIR